MRRDAKGAALTPGVRKLASWGSCSGQHVPHRVAALLPWVQRGDDRRSRLYDFFEVHHTAVNQHDNRLGVGLGHRQRERCLIA